MPTAPASSCICAISGILWVLVWGRSPTPQPLQRSCMLRTLWASTSRSTNTDGVSRSLALVALGMGSPQRLAMHSISTAMPMGRAPAWMVVRAGNGAVK